MQIHQWISANKQWALTNKLVGISMEINGQHEDQQRQ